MASKTAGEQKPPAHPRNDGRPEWVIVSGRRWDIEWYQTEDAFKTAFCAMGDPDQWSVDLGAATFQWEMKIRAAAYTHTQLQKENILHEVMHACFYAAHGWGDEDVDTSKRDWEEYIISAIDTPLLIVLRDNPHLLKWLVS